MKLKKDKALGKNHKFYLAPRERGLFRSYKRRNIYIAGKKTLQNLIKILDAG